MLRKEVYNAAVGSAKARGKLTDQEAAELAKIQKFLALRDDQVDKTKRDLNRLRLLTEIRQGNLPTVPKDHPALRGLMLDAGEIAHYAVQVDVLDRPTTMGRDGVPVKWRAHVSRSRCTGCRRGRQGAGRGLPQLNSACSSGRRAAAMNYCRRRILPMPRAFAQHTVGNPARSRRGRRYREIGRAARRDEVAEPLRGLARRGEDPRS